MVESGFLLNYSKLNCAIRYLKSVDKLDSTYPEYDTQESDQCQSFVDKFLDDCYDDVRKFFSESSSHVDCIIAKLRMNSMADAILKRVVLMHSESMTRREKSIKINGVSFQINFLLTQAVNFCLLLLNNVS